MLEAPFGRSAAGSGAAEQESDETDVSVCRPALTRAAGRGNVTNMRRFHSFFAGRRSPSWILLSTAALLLMGCSGGEGSDSDVGGGGASSAPSDSGGRSSSGDFANAPPIELEDLCPLYTQDLCIYLQECNDAPYRDQEHCEQELQCFGLPQLEDSAENGRVLYDPKAVGSCHARFIDDPCGFAFFFFTPDIYEVLAECEGTLTPQQESGEECLSDGECVSGYCNKEGRMCPGSCDSFAQEGESCAKRRCASELDCENGTCRAAIPIGEPCSESGDCYASSSLRIGGELVEGSRVCDLRTNTCIASPVLGEACGLIDSGKETQFFAFCDVGWCNDDFAEQPTGTCQPDGGLGDTCGDCEEGLACIKGDIFDALGTCQEPGSEGTLCFGSSDCSDGLRCSEEGVCASLLREGADCRFDDDCASDICGAEGSCIRAAYPGDACGAEAECVFANCREGVCVRRLRVGESCVEDADCATSECVDGTCYDDSVCARPDGQ